MTDLTLKKKIDDFKLNIVKNYQKDLLNYFMKNEGEMFKFMSGVVYSIQKIPSLLNDTQGLIGATLELAQLGISPGITQEAYILPFKGKSTAMIGYQGFVSLLYKAGISSIYAETVRDKDTFKNILGSDPKLIHEVDPKLSEEARGEVIGCYVVVKINGESIYKYMNRADILNFRDKYSQSYKDKEKRKYSPWHENNDPQLNMWKKTVLKQLVKYLPKNEIIAKAIEVDNKEAPVSGLSEVITGGEDDKQKAQEALDKLNSNKEPNE